MNDILELIKVSKSFGGPDIVHMVDLGIIEGEKHALIGPNGAGKTTIFNLITGKYSLSEGSILFKKRKIDGLSPYRIIQRGIARSFQIISLFKEMTVFENLQNAVISRYRRNFKIFPLVRSMKDVKRNVDLLLDRLTLSQYSDIPAEILPYGQQRALEMGLTIALDPDLILLDEPTAGMTREETSEFIELIREVTENKTLLVIEHDMDVVFNLADRISVLNHGEIIATGTPEEIRQNTAVEQAYLGTNR